MKLSYVAPCGRLSLETEVANAKAAFEQIAEIDEVFAETQCGCCQSPAIRFDVRRVDSFRFFEIRCRACGARLDVGQHKDAESLFIKRRDDAGRPLPHNGWYVYQPQEARNENQESPLPSSPSVPRSEASTDPWAIKLQLAATETDRRKVVVAINAEIKAGRIANGRKTALLEAAERRKMEITKAF